jgi:hypothetical protein
MLVLLIACDSKAPSSAAVTSIRQETLTVFATVFLTEAFGEIVFALEAGNPGMDVRNGRIWRQDLIRQEH